MLEPTKPAARKARRPLSPAATLQHLTQHELADRWRISHRTLERWRCAGQGPAYLKLGGSVVYRIADVEAFEAAQRRSAAARSERAMPREEQFTRGLRR